METARLPLIRAPPPKTVPGALHLKGFQLCGRLT